jgi:hypothetical protein
MPGDQGSGKSFVTLDTMLRMQHGMRFFDGRAMAAGSSIMLCGEGHAGMAARVRLWLQQHPHQDCGDRYCLISNVIPVLSKTSMPKVQKLVERVTKWKGHAPKVIVVDTLSQGLDDDENDSKVVSPVLRGLAAIRDKYGCAIWIVHHFVKLNTNGQRGKSRPKPNIDSVRGSGALTRNMDCVLGVTTEDGGLRRLTVWKQRDGAQGVSLTFRLVPMETGRHRRDGGAETSCLVVPDVSVAFQPPAAAEKEEQQSSDKSQADADRRNLVLARRAVTKVIERGSAPGRETLAVWIGGRLTSARAGVDLALQVGCLVNSGTPRKPRLELATQPPAGCVCGSPHTPLPSGTADGEAAARSASASGTSNGTAGTGTATVANGVHGPDMDDGVPEKPKRRRRRKGNGKGAA